MPPVVVFLAKHPMVKQYDSSSVIRAGSGAAPLAKDVEEEFRARLKLSQMAQGKVQ